MRTTLLLLLLAPAAVAATPAELVAKLGDPDYHTREAAGKELLALGAAALPAVEVGCGSDTPEVASRCERLLGTIRRTLTTDAVLAPATVDLPAGDISLGKLFDLIQKQTRYKLALNGDQAALSTVVTLKGGKATFWEAVGEACPQAKLCVLGMTTQPVPRDDKTSPLGVVTLSAGTPSAGTSVKGLRVEAGTLGGDELGRYSDAQLPIVVKVTAEPGVRWGGVTEVSLLDPLTPDGRKLGPDPTPVVHATQLDYDEMPRIRRKGGYRLPFYRVYGETQKVVPLAAGDLPPSELASVRGIVRGIVWAPPAELAAVKVGDAEEMTEGPHGTVLSARLLKPQPGDPQAPIIEVMLRWDQARVRQEVVQVESGAGEGVWFENRGGKLVPVKAADPVKADAKKPTPNEVGLVCTAADGSALVLSNYGSTVRQVADGTRAYTVRTDKYVVMKDRSGAGVAATPAAVAFHASHVTEVAVPFALKNVPLARGTGTGSQQRDPRFNVETR